MPSQPTNNPDPNIRLDLLVAGSNSHGQLGLGHTDDVHHFALAHSWDSDTEIISFASGARHSLILTRNRCNHTKGFVLLGAGDRSNHQLPALPPHDETFQMKINSRFEELDLRALILSLHNVNHTLLQELATIYYPTKVACTWETSFVVLTPFDHSIRSSFLIAFGGDDFGVRGTRSPLARLSEPNLVDFHLGAESIITICDLVAGPKHAMAVIASHRLGAPDVLKVDIFGWGAARHGQLGSQNPAQVPPKILPPTRVPIPFDLPRDPTLIKIGVGKEHTIIVCPGVIYSLGSQKYGQKLAPDAPMAGAITAAQCCWNTTFLLKQPDTQDEEMHVTLTGFGNNSQAQLGTLDSRITILERPLLGPGPVRLAVGSEHVLLSDQSDMVYGWGWNEHGNLGTTPSIDQDLVIQKESLIWQAHHHQKLVNLSAGCATSFLFIHSLPPSLGNQPQSRIPEPIM